MDNTDKPKTEFDAVRFKEQERAGFNLVAERYEAAMLEMTQPVVEHILAMAQLRQGLHVLDIATGPGLLARQIAPLVGMAEGRVIGIDIAEDAIRVAQKRAEAANLTNLTFATMDAEALTFNDNEFNRVICSMGLMHFPAPEKALLEMYRVLRVGGRLVAAVWGESHNAAFIQLALDTFAKVFPPPKVERPSMFRFGQADILAKLVADAGFVHIETKPVTVPVRINNAADYWKRFLDVAGVTTVTLAKQPPEVMQKLEDESAKLLAEYPHDGQYKLDSTIMLVSGVK